MLRLHFVLLLLQTSIHAYCETAPLVADTTHPPSKSRQIQIVTALDFFTTFAGFHVLNGTEAEEKNNLHVYYNFSINNIVKAGSIKFTNYFYTELGLKMYFDSISVISEDAYTLKNSLSYSINQSKIAVNIAISTKSQFFRHYDYRSDSSDGYNQFLYTSYLSPGYTDYSFGLKLFLNDFATLEFGLVNGRVTRIRNQGIFDSRQCDFLYGLRKGEKEKTEYGFSLAVNLMATEIFKNILWENFSQVNVAKDDVHMVKYYQCDINNALHYRFFKHLRLTLKTRFLYDVNLSSKPKLTNAIIFGFYLNNKI